MSTDILVLCERVQQNVRGLLGFKGTFGQNCESHTETNQHTHMLGAHTPSTHQNDRILFAHLLPQSELQFMSFSMSGPYLRTLSRTKHVMIIKTQN